MKITKRMIKYTIIELIVLFIVGIPYIFIMVPIIGKELGLAIPIILLVLEVIVFKIYTILENRKPYEV